MSYKYISPQDYVDIFSDSKWYLKLEKELKEFFYDYDGKKENKTKEWLARRDGFVQMVADFLENNKIAFGKSGINWDKERLPIDTIVIHHSSRSQNTPISIINALGLIRLYAKEYSKKKEKQFGKPIWSNHFYKGKLTFIAYHYLIKADGLYEQILKDEYIGWHCGNWGYNRRSIAICFLDDLEEKMPTKKAIQAAKEIMKKHPNCKILGHREINDKTTCSSNLFLGKNGWKRLLI